MRRTALAILVFAALGGCDQLKPPKMPDAPEAPEIPGVGGRDENSGGDHVRGKAVEIKLGETHDDHVSAPEGDHTDWKKFKLPQPADLTLVAYWDDPSAEVVLTVRDQFGGQIFQVFHKKGERSNRWPGMKLREGEYYLEVLCTDGGSVYTLELLADGLPGGGSGPTIAPPE